MLDLETLTHKHYDPSDYKTILEDFSKDNPFIYERLHSIIQRMEQAITLKDEAIFNQLEFMYAHAMGYWQYRITEDEQNIFNNTYLCCKEMMYND